MRDIILTLLVLGLLPHCFRKPYIGLLTFSWLAYMRAQDLCWGFARTLRFSLLVAVALVLGFLLNERSKRFFLPDLRNYLILVIGLLAGISIFFSYTGFDKATTDYYVEFVKILFIALLTTTLVDTKLKLKIFCWVIALSLGFFGIKTGIFGILTGGGTRVLQGPGGMLKDNNDFSLAMAMNIPFLFYLGLSEKDRRLRWGFQAAALLTMITVVLTFSRGGFLSMAGVVFLMVWRSRRRFQGIAAGAIVALLFLAFIPDEYKERLSTIKVDTEESSAKSRLEAWALALELVEDHPLIGVGFRNFQVATAIYDPTKDLRALSGSARTIVAHNSYLQVWAEMGTPAIVIYLTLIGSTFWLLRGVRREAYRSGGKDWILNYARMLESTLFCFVIGSTFLNRAHFDLMYHIVTLSVVFAHLARRELRGEVDWDGDRLAPREVALELGPGFGARGSFRSGRLATTPGASAAGFDRARDGSRTQVESPGAEERPGGFGQAARRPWGRPAGRRGPRFRN